MPRTLRYDAIVIGAGISGLFCAKELSGAGFRRVLILESSTRVGGRIHTVHLGEDPKCPADLGASFVHGTIDNPLTKLSKQVPFELHYPSVKTSTRVYPHKARGEPLKEEESEKTDFLSYHVTFNRCHEFAQAGPSVPREESSVWDALTETPAGQGVWKDVTEEERERILRLSPMWAGWTGAKLSDVSLKWWGFENEFRGEDAIVRDGYKQLVEWTLNQAQRQGTELICDSKVVEVQKLEEDDSFRVTARSSDGTEAHFDSDHVVCSVSLGVLQNDPPRFVPPLPLRKLASIKRLGMGLLNKVILKYSTAWWRATLPPDNDGGWMYVLPKGSHASNREYSDDRVKSLEDAPIIAQDYVPIHGQPMLMLFVGPPAAHALEDITTAQEPVLIASLHKRLVDAILVFEQPDPGSPIASVVTRWKRDPHTHGSYSFIPAKKDVAEAASPLDMAELGRPLHDGRLGFCGEATHPDCYASVHGAVMTGIREGRRVALRLREARGGSMPPDTT